jgi:hypothetical protein
VVRRVRRLPSGASRRREAATEFATQGTKTSRLTPPNPLRSEADAFGFLVWFVCVVAAIVVVVLIVEAL